MNSLSFYITVFIDGTLSDRNYVWLVNSERRSGHVMLTGSIDNTHHWSIDVINIITHILPH